MTRCSYEIAHGSLLFWKQCRSTFSSQVPSNLLEEEHRISNLSLYWSLAFHLDNYVYWSSWCPLLNHDKCYIMFPSTSLDINCDSLQFDLTQIWDLCIMRKSKEQVGKFGWQSSSVNLPDLIVLDCSWVSVFWSVHVREPSLLSFDLFHVRKAPRFGLLVSFLVCFWLVFMKSHYIESLIQVREKQPPSSFGTSNISDHDDWYSFAPTLPHDEMGIIFFHF